MKKPNNIKNTISKNDLLYLKYSKSKTLNEVVFGLETELTEKYPDVDKLMAFADDIFVISEKEKLNKDISDRVCSAIDKLIENLNSISAWEKRYEVPFDINTIGLN